MSMGRGMDEGMVYTAIKWITNCVAHAPTLAHGTLLQVMWQPGWEESLGDNG